MKRLLTVGFASRQLCVASASAAHYSGPSGWDTQLWGIRRSQVLNNGYVLPPIVAFTEGSIHEI